MGEYCNCSSYVAVLSTRRHSTSRRHTSSNTSPRAGHIISSVCMRGIEDVHGFERRVRILLSLLGLILNTDTEVTINRGYGLCEVSVISLCDGCLLLFEF